MKFSINDEQMMIIIMFSLLGCIAGNSWWWLIPSAIFWYSVCVIGQTITGDES